VLDSPPGIPLEDIYGCLCMQMYIVVLFESLDTDSM